MKRASAVVLGVAGACALAARLGWTLSRAGTAPASLWPAAGVALAALLIGGRRLWPAVFLGVLASSPGPWPAALAAAALRALEAVAGAWLVETYAEGREAFSSTGGVFRFAAAAAAAAAVGGAAALPGSFAAGWSADCAGMLVFAPPILLLWGSRGAPRRPWENALHLAGSAAAAVFLFAPPPGLDSRGWTASSVSVPLFVWSAVRLGSAQTASAVMLISCIAAWGTAGGHGPFSAGSAGRAAALMQAFAASNIVTFLALAAAVTRDRRSERELRAMRDRLEAEVKERTSELHRTVSALRAQVEERELGSRTLRLYAEAVESAQIGLALFSADGPAPPRLRAANPLADRLIGAGIAGLRAEDLRRLCRETLEKGAPRDLGEHGLPDRRVIAVKAMPLFGRHVGMVFEDVTGHRRAQEQEMLERKETMQRDFVAAVSHAFRTPLAVIMGCAESLQLWGMNDAESQPRLVRTIEKNADKLVRLVEDMLKLSALQSGRLRGRPEPLAPRDVAHLVADRFAAAAERKKLSFRVGIAADVSVQADRQQLEEVFASLFKNAIDCSRRGGVVDVEAEARDGEIVFGVRDGGAGIPESDLPRVFEYFHKNARSRAMEQGTGLSLPIVKSLIESAGGRIWAESDGRAGAAFRFTLPRAELRVENLEAH